MKIYVIGKSTHCQIDIVRISEYNYSMDMFNAIDWIIIGLCAIGAIWGAIKGFVDEFSQKTGYIAGLASALMFTKRIIPKLTELGLPFWLGAFISYLVLFMTGFLIIKMFGTILKRITDTAGISFVDNLLGFFLGFAEMVFIVGILETVLTAQTVFPNLPAQFNQSIISQKIIMPVFNIARTSVQGLM